MAQKILLQITVLLVLILALTTAVQADIPTFTAKEGELLYLSAETFDIDEDTTYIIYPAPFDSDGRWLTDYESAGEYILTITVIDQEGNQVYQDIRLTIEENNQEPGLTENSLIYEEGDLITLTHLITDPDKDILTYSFEAPFNENGQWQTSYDDAGRYVTNIKISDQEITIIKQVEITINEKNAPSMLEEIFQASDTTIFIKENEELTIFAIASDQEDDPITYTWYLDETIYSNEPSTTLKFDYNSEGQTHTLSLKLSDQATQDTTDQTESTVSEESQNQAESWYNWIIEITNNNRAPNIDDLEITTSEGNNLSLDLPLADDDGDTITYTFDQLFNEDKTWNTGYEDAGEYEVIGFASDGELTSQFQINVQVEDIDRAPAIFGSPSYYRAEGETLSFIIEATDPDQDETTITALSDLPEGATLSTTGEFYWEIKEDTIKRNENWFTNILNTLRLEKYFTTQRTIDLHLKACGKELCSEAHIDIIITNVNQAPEITELNDQSIYETELLQLYVEATDTDNDIIKYYFTEPLNRNGQWQTRDGDEGTEYVTVTASDGSLTDSKTVAITVNKKNRAPEFKATKDSYTVLENEEISFQLAGKDKDDDNLTITLTSGPTDATFNDNTFIWTPGYDTVQNKSNTLTANLYTKNSFLTKYFSKEQASQWLEFTLSDGEEELIMPIELIIKNQNRAPQITATYPAENSEYWIDFNDQINFDVTATDEDNDELEYFWKFAGLDFQTIEGTSSIGRVFTSSGRKDIQVKVCDQRDCTMHKWTIYVEGDEPKETTTTSSSTSTVTVDPNSNEYQVITVEDWKEE